MTHPILVVGIGAEGPESLSNTIQERIAQADQLLGGERLLVFWHKHPAKKVIIGSNIPELVERLRQRGNTRVVILASGDPGFYGIAGTLLRHFAPDELEILPRDSSLQLAFARAGIAWSDAVFTSAHARPLAKVVGLAKRVPKLGILTDGVQTPAVIAQALLAARVDDCRAIVAENLGLPDERLTDTRLSALPGKDFAPLNVLLLARDEGWRPYPQLAPRPEGAYAHRRGMITKADVRALSLARLALSETDTVWDIGGGSGAMSIEMAELAWQGNVFAVERDPESLDYMRNNIRRFGTLNVIVVEGSAPAALAELPQPSAVFVGGTGGEMEAILMHVGQVAQLGCRVVINLVTLENLSEALALMQSLGWSPQVTQVSLARGKAIEGLTRLAPLNPVFILAGVVG